MALIKFKRGEVWLADFDPQTHKEETGKRRRPVLVIQTDLLNDSGHSTTVVIPGTTKVRPDSFPLRVNIGSITGRETDLMIDQPRTIANQRFMGTKPIAKLATNHLKRVEEALRLLIK